MRFINHKDAIIILANDFSNQIVLKPGEVSSSFVGNIKLVNQFISQGSEIQLAIVRENQVDDTILTQCPTAIRYIHNSVDEALTKLTVFGYTGEKSAQVTGESLNKMEEQREKIEDLNKTIANKDLIIGSLTKANEDLTEEKKLLEGKIERLNKEYIGYKDQVTIRKNSDDAELDKVKSEVAGLNATINNLNSEKTSLGMELDTAKKTILARDQEIKDLNAKIDTSCGLTADKESEIERLGKLLTEKDEANVKESVSRINAEKQLKEATDKIDELTTKLTKLTEKSANDAATWNKVCQMFNISVDGEGNWHCSYKAE